MGLALANCFTRRKQVWAQSLRVSTSKFPSFQRVCDEGFLIYEATLKFGVLACTCTVQMKLLFEANNTTTTTNTSLKGNKNQDNKVPLGVIALSLSVSGNRGLGNSSKFRPKTSREKSFYKKLRFKQNPVQILCIDTPS